MKKSFALGLAGGLVIGLCRPWWPIIGIGFIDAGSIGCSAPPAHEADPVEFFYDASVG